ncbi:MAG: T9SS type A sorting domain-containing protein [Clostridia bacterium]|nr:T9SS type A sorting domain-containing protein [Clostridia bacterium]
MMKNLQTIRYALLLVIVAGNMHLHAQTWPKFYGEPTRYDNSYDIAEAYDKGYFILGYYYSNNTLPKTWLIKTNVNGEVIWEKIFNSYYNKSSALDPTLDGGVLICGNNQRTEGVKIDPYVIKIDACGEKEWCINFAESHENSYPWAQDIKELPSGDIVVLVNEYGNHPINTLHLFKLNASGDVLWRNPYASGYEHPGSLNPRGNEILITSSNQYLITGHIYWEDAWNPGGLRGIRSMFVMIDSTGNEEWVLPFGTADTIFGQGYNIYERSHGSFIGIVNKWPIESMQTILVNFDSLGKVLQYVKIENANISPDIIKGVPLDFIKHENVFILGGIYGTLQQGLATEIILDTNIFNTINVLNHKSHFGEEPYSMRKTNNKKILTNSSSLYSSRDIFLAKLNSNLEYDTLDPGAYTYDSLCATPGLPQTGFISLSDCGLFVGIDEIPTPQQYNERISQIPITAFPNPVKEDVITLEFENTQHHTLMELRCYDSYGRLLHSQKIYRGQQQTRLDVSDWSPGMYIAVINVNGSVRGKVRFVKE